MKLSLRNLALATTVMVAGAAMAQEAAVPTVTKVWSYDQAGTNKKETRFGTGFGGKVYYNDKAAGKIMVIDATGVKEYATVEGLGTGITADDAGNILVNKGFSGAASSTNMVIVKPDGTQVPLTLAMPAGVEANRVDQIGRIAGDVFSEDGGYFFEAINTVNKAVMFRIANGAQSTEGSEYWEMDMPEGVAVNTGCVFQPTATGADMAGMGDDALTAWAFRNRDVQTIYFGDGTTMPKPAGANSQEGFDVFLLGDKMYQIQPSKKAVNYESNFVIADEEGNIIFTCEDPDLGDGDQSFGSFAARTIDEYTVEVYQYFTSGKGNRGAMYRVELPKPVVPQYADRAHFAYDLQVSNEGSKYTINFKSTGDAASAVLVLTNVADEFDQITYTLPGSVKAGLNTAVYDAKDLAEGKQYKWAIELHGYEVQETKVTEVVNVGGGSAALAVFNDPQSKFYGYTVIGRTKASGIDVYNPAGELVMNAVHPQAEAFGGAKANTSSPMDAITRGDEVLFASWGDAAYGVAAFDLNTPEKAPYSVFEGEKAASGLISKDGVNVGSGTPCVEIYGEGEDAYIYTFDEDIFGNNVARVKIGTAKTTGAAAEQIGYKSLLANTDVQMKSTPYGILFSQKRGKGTEPGTPPVVLYSPEKGDIVWNMGQLNADLEAGGDTPLVPSCNGGVDINAAGDLMAISTYTSIEVFLLSWEDDLPVLEPYASVPFANDGGRAVIAFDPANNIHSIRRNSGYQVISLPEVEPIATSAAKADSYIANTTGVESIEAGAADGVETFYNINGVRVDKANMAPGVYVKVANGKSQKVIVK